MTLLQQIQNEAVDTNADVAGLLRRCRILAQRLGVIDFKNWVIWELEGYPSIEALPEYRVLHTPLILGHFHGHFGRRLENAQIPLTRIPERFRKALTTLPFQQGVGSISEMLRGKQTHLNVPWPADVLPYIGQGDIYDGLFLVQAIRSIGFANIRDILDQVQNRVLNFVLELESRNPEAGEPIMKSKQIPTDQVRNIFNTVIKGGVQNLAQASHGFSQVSQSQIGPGDVASLRRALSELGIDDANLRDLEKAIGEDSKSGAIGMGAKVKAWLGEICVKTADGAITIAAAAGTTAVVEAVKRFFGA